MNWITKNVFGFIADTIESLLVSYGDMIEYMFEIIADANLNNSMLTNAAAFTTTFALVCLALIAGKQCLDVYVFETAGDDSASPFDLVVRLAQAVAVIGSSAWIFNEMLALSKWVASDLMIATNGSHDYSNFLTGNILNQIGQARQMLETQGVAMLVTSAMTTIGLIIFSITAGIRGAELTLMKLLFPLFAIDLLTTDRERWKNFITSVVVIIFSYGLQLALFKMCCLTLSQINYDGGITTRFVTAIGFIVLMIRAPKWLEKWAYTTGVASATLRLTKTVTSIFMLKGGGR